MRSSLYLLGAALFDEPRPESKQALHALLWRVIYRSPVEARWVRPLLEIADAHERQDRLQREYARLFKQPEVAARPYGSYWLEAEREPMGRTTGEVDKLMRRHGMGMERHPGMLPDHLVAEMELMAHLIDRERVEHTLSAEQHLVHNHLSVWVPQFTGALRSCAPSRFYRMAAHYVEDVIRWDVRRLAPDRRPIAA